MKRFLALLVSLMLLLGCTHAFAEASELPFMEISYVSWHCGEIEEGNYLEKILEEQFNVDFKISRLDLSNAEQVNLALASGEMPEFAWQIGEPYDLYEVQGLTRLIPKEMIETYAPMYTASLNEQPLGWNYHYKADENAYMGLTGRTIGSSRAFIAVRLDWLENLGIEIPEYTKIEGLTSTLPEFYDRMFMTKEQWTADELYAVMDAFTNKDPDGNGKNDTYGFQTDAGDSFTWNALYHMFSMHGGGSWEYTIANEDGSADVYFASQNYYRFLEYWSKAYAAGMMDKEYVVNTRESAFEKYANGVVGIANMMSQWNHSFASAYPPFNVLSRNENAKVLIMPVPTENDGSYAVPNYSISPYNYRFVVRADVSDEKLARMLQIFDYVNFDENAQILYRYGEEGVHFNYTDPENKAGFSFTENGYYGKDLGLWVFNSNYIQTPTSYRVNTMPYGTDWENFANEVYTGEHVLQPYKLNLFTNDYTEAYLEAEDLYKTAINTVVAEYRTAVITGEKDLEATWDEYLAEINDMGYAEVREIINQLPTYDDFVSGNF